MMNALIFDCDGVIVDCELQRHRAAFNRVWSADGIPWQWTETGYRAALAVAGGKERLYRLRDDPAFCAVFDVPTDDAEWRAVVAAWHRRKTDVYTELVHEHGLVPRTGVRRLVNEALEAGWSVAVASAGARASVTEVLRCALGPNLLAELAVITGEDVTAKKPSPQVFDIAAAAVGADPGGCVVFEDTRNGLLGAVAAGMTCVVTPTQLTFHDNFAEAALVISGIGEPSGPAEVVLGGWWWTTARPYLSIGDLRELLTTGQPVGSISG